MATQGSPFLAESLRPNEVSTSFVFYLLVIFASSDPPPPDLFVLVAFSVYYPCS